MGAKSLFVGGIMDCEDSEIDTAVQLGSHLIHTILSSSPADLPTIESLVKAGAPLWYQEEDGGLSALHAACIVENSDMVRMLIENGAVWNCVDDLGYTAADIALSLNDAESYGIIRDAGIRSEYLLHLLSSRPGSASAVLRSNDTGPFGSTDAFLESKLLFSKDAHGQEICSVMSQGETVGVMMGWERGIMQTTVEILCGTQTSRSSRLHILNVGFGLGIIDTLFQDLDPPPERHTIIEPHKDVIAHMRANGWQNRPNVEILEGCWQDFVKSGQIYGERGWDIVYIDTFAEGYGELKKFFDILPRLLSGPQARFSFFNGLGATNALFYDVYTQLAVLHLKSAGLDVQWTDVDVDEAKAPNRWGDTKEYFKVRLYRLPLGKLAQV